jgi:hypothetical protein
MSDITWISHHIIIHLYLDKCLLASIIKNNAKELLIGLNKHHVSSAGSWLFGLG